MQAIFDVVLPVFGIMFAGYLSGRTKLLGEASSQALNRFVYFVALPALFFVSLSRVELGEVFDWPFLAAFGGGLTVTFVVALVVARLAFSSRLGPVGMNAICAIFSNTGYMGIPLVLLIYGEAGLLPGIITTVITGVVVIAMATVILEIDASTRLGPVAVAGRVLIGVLRSPLLLSALGGLAVSGLGLELPRSVQTFCDILGAAAAPCALFAIGLFMVDTSLRTGLTEVGWIAVLKLIVQPALTWWLAFEVLALPPVWAGVAVVQAALPTGALVFVIAQQYGVYVQRATAVILVSTLASVITLSLLLIQLGVG
jgi:predicted permease